MHGGGPRYLRKKRVPTDWREWIDQCLSSFEADDAAGIAVDLREFTGERHEIVAFLEERLANYSRNQRRTFLGPRSPAGPRSKCGSFTEMEARVTLLRQAYGGQARRFSFLESVFICVHLWLKNTLIRSG